jgi:hypothetical protein
MAPALPPPLSVYTPGDLDVGMSFGFNGSSVSLLGAAAAHIYIFEIIKTAATSKQRYPLER